ncbi:type III-A CRISPR-associated protein Csm2 [Fusobacterium periodonticum]|uniref:CRISPR system Cms protein Csm2 n=2 Tax=Fusobacterium periodonticum TaxID=860 RepID=A0AAD0MR19_9FUSO|nr:type III-A CRISPR-associated protein Csm2 [Fusobacterium periodonticum]AVQ25189.1 type III-A CRISPR-associated protein Csm2 [Fusobacterium periodonticum]KGE63684.1 CRISPR type III-a/mtube-associated protein csm2 [Fusobacterium periodonticum 2_1_31]
MNNINVQEKIEKYQEDKKNTVTTTQLRLLLSNAVIIKNKIQVETRTKKGDEISEKLENEIKYLLVKHIYQCGREPKVKRFDNEFHISEKIKSIGKSAKKFNEFYRYLEEIVAYMKYYESDNK